MGQCVFVSRIIHLPSEKKRNCVREGGLTRGGGKLGKDVEKRVIRTKGKWQICINMAKILCACFSSTNTKIQTTNRLTWSLYKDVHKSMKESIS